MCLRVLADEDLEAASIAQDEVMRKLARRGIAVECNPSSNCVIGTFREYVLHPMF